MVLPSCGGSARGGGPAPGNPLKAAGKGVRLADGRGTPQKQQERGLEGVLGIGQAAKGPTADAQDHRAVPPDDFLKGRLVPGVEEGAEQLAVASSGLFPAGSERPD